jgi:hypothetical protein
MNHLLALQEKFVATAIPTPMEEDDEDEEDDEVPPLDAAILKDAQRMAVEHKDAVLLPPGEQRDKLIAGIETSLNKAVERYNAAKYLHLMDPALTKLMVQKPWSFLCEPRRVGCQGCGPMRVACVCVPSNSRISMLL